jgi:isopentenyldiphosphate isomerase
MPGDEMVAIVDAGNREVGAAPRSEMRRQGLIHRSSYILVWNGQGELYVQKRTLTKDIYPGYWDVAAGGVVLAGETYEQGASRELAEELGIENVPLEPQFDFYFEDRAESGLSARVWGRVFACRWEGPLRLQAEEVERVVLMTPEEVLRRAGQEPFTPDGIEVVRRVLKTRRSA